MKLLLASFSVLLLSGCKTEPFLKHKLQFEKMADNCGNVEGGIKMNSNLNGERYEFQRCLDADFDKSQVSSTRKGDTVVVQFERKNPKKALYNIIIDIDTYPRYNFLTIDGTTIPIVPYEN